MSTPQPRTKVVRLPIGDLPIHHLESAFLTKNDVSKSPPKMSKRYFSSNILKISLEPAMFCHLAVLI